MTKSRFEKITNYLKSHSGLLFLLKFVYTFLPALVFLAYPSLIVYLFVTGSIGELIKVIVVPAVTFLGVSVLRVLLNMPRPYEKMNIEPIIMKKTKGKSFPSRHSASVFIIAMAFMYINIYAGIAMLCVGIIIVLSRVLAGVHYVKDVIAGMLFSVILGIFGFFII